MEPDAAPVVVTETLPQTAPIEPSEAIRLGRMLVPARSMGVLARRRRGQVVSVCALGAMAVGFGQDAALPPEKGDHSQHWWPGGVGAAPRLTTPCQCPPDISNASFQFHDPLPGRRVWDRHRAYRAPYIVAHLSDRHGTGRAAPLGDYWSSERIADWLAENDL